MKILKLSVLFFLLSAGIAKAQFTRAELQVSGLTCSLCSKVTERSLRALSFVSEIKTDLLKNKYIITFKNNTAVNFDEISKIVHDSGFFVNSLKASFNFDNVKVNGNYFNYDNDRYQVMNVTDTPLNGIIALTIIDKGFAPRSVSKKYLSQATAEAPLKNGRLYHLAI